MTAGRVGPRVVCCRIPLQLSVAQRVMNTSHDFDEESQDWDLLDAVLQESQEEEVEADSAEACRTQSDSEDESTCNVWWVPLLKSHVSRSMAEMKPGFNNKTRNKTPPCSKGKVVNVVQCMLRMPC